MSDTLAPCPLVRRTPGGSAVWAPTGRESSRVPRKAAHSWLLQEARHEITKTVGCVTTATRRVRHCGIRGDDRRRRRSAVSRGTRLAGVSHRSRVAGRKKTMNSAAVFVAGCRPMGRTSGQTTKRHERLVIRLVRSFVRTVRPLLSQGTPVCD